MHLRAWITVEKASRSVTFSCSTIYPSTTVALREMPAAQCTTTQPFFFFRAFLMNAAASRREAPIDAPASSSSVMSLFQNFTLRLDAAWFASLSMNSAPTAATWVQPTWRSASRFSAPR